MPENSKNFIPDTHARQLISAHDGDMALLYIWLDRNGSYDKNRAAADLCRTGAEIEAAYEKLQRLMNRPAAAAPDTKKTETVTELPEYSSKDVVARSETDSGFSAVIDHTRGVLGRVLSGPDLKILFRIYDYLGLPPDVICELVTYCTQRFAESYGPGRLPTIHQIEKEAEVWANNEILSFEQAEEYIVRQKQRRDEANRVKQALGIRDRELSKTEKKYIASWLDLGYDAESLAIAYDRTVTNAGGLKWAYMNKIVLSWNEKGLKTPEEIEEKDRRTPKMTGGSRQTCGLDRTELDRMKAIYDKVKNG